MFRATIENYEINLVSFRRRLRHIKIKTHAIVVACSLYNLIDPHVICKVTRRTLECSRYTMYVSCLLL
jgi:hypothetical protein